MLYFAVVFWWLFKSMSPSKLENVNFSKDQVQFQKRVAAHDWWPAWREQGFFKARVIVLMPICFSLQRQRCQHLLLFLRIYTIINALTVALIYPSLVRTQFCRRQSSRHPSNAQLRPCNPSGFGNSSNAITTSNAIWWYILFIQFGGALCLPHLVVHCVYLVW